MKKILFFILCSIILIPRAYAATPTVTPSPSQIQKQIDDLKERIASRVAQLKLVERKGIMGTVTEVSAIQITITDVKGETRIIDVDELTKFKGKDSFGISDIKKGQNIGVVGLYNKQSRRILARVIELVDNTKFVSGFVASIDSQNFSLNIATDSPQSGEASKSEQLEIEIETTTKTLTYDRESKKLVRTGFSKMVVNEAIFIVGTPVNDSNNQISADRIIVLPDITKGPTLSPIPSIVPSTGSGKKLTPIVK